MSAAVAFFASAGVTFTISMFFGWVSSHPQKKNDPQVQKGASTLIVLFFWLTVGLVFAGIWAGVIS